MKTEKQKMLAGEPYLAWDEELYAERIECRKVLQKLNNSIPDSDEWRSAIDTLIPDSEGSYLEPPFRCDYGSNIKPGKNFYANFNCVILDVAEVTIGDNVLFAPNVQVLTAGHPLDVKSRVDEGVEFGTPITIGDNAWIGAGVIICPGVNIGKNSVIGAGSVVTKDVPDNVVAVGNPCRVLKPIDNE
ncbi:sugar O-acetyltransferase [Vibrio crassostreae]|uniref:sugar O-acetyltransferase n=1 Tax=Vibrio crassostreae TaxID=246167 RepID=UPI000F494B9D|nr:sugar O-acetyltransferase [Vibrio crassostreae]ROS69643.1 maltose O-acetyltransferase [Vibrio crassostreae]RPF23961.1 maltose O-acetyltransferase [Vibrio crassostreae]TCN64620.1 maltose O-acetyltransferase [Vibrio crassostreae]TCT42210.1 maltose O-acetyltransferase [Vibrio crassostreae]TCV06526.1 maltose O-acetyltransferase [Vibrio crassostreae]